MAGRPPPNLNDPAELAAYRKELRGIAPWWRWTGVALAVIGAVLLVLRSRHVLAIHILVPILIIVVAIVAMSVAMLSRSLYHARRMRGGA